MISEQLSLELGMPWDGVSPRYLTKGRLVFSLASEGTGRSIGMADPSLKNAAEDPLQLLLPLEEV